MNDPWATIKVTVAEIRIAMSAENMYYTAKEIGHEPSAIEAVIHFLKHKEQRPTQLFDVAQDGNGLFV